MTCWGKKETFTPSDNNTAESESNLAVSVLMLPSRKILPQCKYILSITLTSLSTYGTSHISIGSKYWLTGSLVEELFSKKIDVRVRKWFDYRRSHVQQTAVMCVRRTKTLWHQNRRCNKLILLIKQKQQLEPKTCKDTKDASIVSYCHRIFGKICLVVKSIIIAEIPWNTADVSPTP